MLASDIDKVGMRQLYGGSVVKKRYLNGFKSLEEQRERGVAIIRVLRKAGINSKPSRGSEKKLDRAFTKLRPKASDISAVFLVQGIPYRERARVMNFVTKKLPSPRFKKHDDETHD